MTLHTALQKPSRNSHRRHMGNFHFLLWGPLLRQSVQSYHNGLEIQCFLFCVPEDNSFRSSRVIDNHMTSLYSYWGTLACFVFTPISLSRKGSVLPGRVIVCVVLVYWCLIYYSVLPLCHGSTNREWMKASNIFPPNRRHVLCIDVMSKVPIFTVLTIINENLLYNVCIRASGICA